MCDHAIQYNLVYYVYIESGILYIVYVICGTYFVYCLWDCLLKNNWEK